MQHSANVMYEVLKDGAVWMPLTADKRIALRELNFLSDTYPSLDNELVARIVTGRLPLDHPDILSLEANQ